MAMYATGMMVVRTNKSNYNLDKTSKIIRENFPDKCHASTSSGTDEDTKVIWADEEGALVEFNQGSGYKNRGLLYYKNQDLKLVKRPEEVINDYQIY